MFIKCLKGFFLFSFLGLAQASNPAASTVIDLSKLLKMDQLLDDIAENQVIFVGETHSRYDHHLNQLAIIKSQHERHEKLAIGLEFIQQPFQSVLDEYIKGNIDEKSLLQGTEYFERWGYDYRLYRPLFRFARDHGIPLIALNIDRDITDTIKSAGIEKLSDEQKRQLPDEINRDDENYRKRLHDIFLLHPHADDKRFDSFVEIQLLWDESMAATAAKWLKQHPDGHMVILAGSGHITYGSGIPDRLKRRVPVTAASVISVSDDSPITADMGDFVIMTDEQKLPPTGKLGVFLDVEQSPPGVSGFSANSGAKKAGLKKGDKIIRIDDKQITSYFDIRYTLIDKLVDDTVSVEVIRENLLLGSQNYSFEVTLK